MTIAAIPTLYHGIQFRSRLEAKWAAFFDGLGWPWAYEPFDHAGWIPDFVITGEIPFLVEVKPDAEPDDAVMAKIDCATDGKHWVLLTSYEPDFRIIQGWPSLGVMRAGGRLNDRGWEESLIGKMGRSWGLRTDTHHGRDFLTGHWSSQGPVTVPIDELRALWAEACNATQWRGKGDVRG